MPSPRHVVAFLLAMLLPLASAFATWSIVIVDLATGEVAVAIATCLTGFDLRPTTVVVVPGFGAAAAQSFVGPLSLRELIRSGLLAGTPAQQILTQLAAADAGHQVRQYGIVSLVGGRTTFTGNQAMAWAGGVTGQVGTLAYAIQGNILTGQPVVTAAELALQNTPGTLADKLMAAMEAANAMGGDGRCSCSSSAPTSCGAPPASFTKAAHIALMIVSRPSDADAACSSGLGCAAGQYWLDLNVANQQASDPDPIQQLRTRYTTWRAQQVGRPDHFTSTVSLSTSIVRADGVDALVGTVVLRDAQGNPLGNTRPLTVTRKPGATATGLVIGPVTAQPNGTYTFPVTGGLVPGQAVLDVATTDAFGRVGIWPQPTITVSNVFGACAAGAVPNGSGGTADVLRVNGIAGAERIVPVGYGQPFTIDVQAPPAAPSTFPVGLFALWAHVGIPPAGPGVPLGGSSGALCFLPAPFAPFAPTLLLADSFGLGGAIVAPGAPWSLPVPGVPALLDLALQGVQLVDPAANLAATNALLLRIVPLPTPTLTALAPLAGVPGQTVFATGTNFLPGIAGAVGGVPVPLSVVSPTQLSFVMPAGFACDAPLVVANLGGAQATRNANPTPTVTTSPSTGSSAGGTQVVLVGQNLLGCTVTIHGTPMPITTQVASVILGTLPPGVAGPGLIVVRNPNGCQTTRAFTYQ